MIAAGPPSRAPSAVADFRALERSEQIGVVGLYLFAFFAWLGQTGAYLGALLMLIGVLMQWRRFGRALIAERLLWALAALLLTLTISTGLALLERPQQSPRQIDAAIDIFILWGFAFVAWWLRGSQRRLLWLCALALGGFLLGRVRALDADTVNAVLHWQRAGFGLPVIAFGQYSAAALLGLALLAPRLWQRLSERVWYRRWPATLALTLLALLALQGVMISGSRGVWLALAAVVVVLLVAKKPPPGRPRSAALPGKPALALLVVVVLLLNSPVILQRFAFGDKTFIDLVLSGRFEHIEDIAVQARLLMLEAGLQWWWQKPWFGWGPGATPHLLEAANNPLIATQGFNDLHNIGVDMLVRLGVVGSLVLLTTAWLIFRMLRRSCLQGRLDRDLYLLLLALLTLHFLCALTNFRVLNSDWRFYWMLFAGAACSFELARYSQRRCTARRATETL